MIKEFKINCNRSPDNVRDGEEGADGEGAAQIPGKPCFLLQADSGAREGGLSL